MKWVDDKRPDEYICNNIPDEDLSLNYYMLKYETDIAFLKFDV